MLRVLAPFYQATKELSEEKKGVGVKGYSIDENDPHWASTSKTAAQQLAENLGRWLIESICNLETLSVLTLATLLDPSFKTVGFVSQLKATEAVKRQKSECDAEMTSHVPDPAEEEHFTWITILFRYENTFLSFCHVIIKN